MMSTSRPFIAVALAAALVMAGCIGASDDEAAPTSTAGQDADGNATVPGVMAEEHATVSIVAGAGLPGGPWVFAGDPQASVTVPDNATRLTVHANLTDMGVNATAPGVGFVGFSLWQGDEFQAVKGTPPETSYTFEVEDPAAGEWTVQVEPMGPDVNREAAVTMLVHGPVPASTVST